MKVIDKAFNENFKNEEIDISKLFKIIFARKKVIFLFTFVSSILGVFYLKFTDPIWEGQFDIVLKSNLGDSKNLNPLSSINSSVLQQFINRSSQMDLRTEVEILRSQSILMPIFKYVKEQRIIEGYDSSNYRFSDWKKKLKIDLERGTSALKIIYRDNNKSSIKPVLTKISKEYQKYSSKDRDRGLSKGINYLENMLLKVQKESNTSLKLLHEYSTKNNLGSFDGIPPQLQNTGLNKVTSPQISRDNLDSPKDSYDGYLTSRGIDKVRKLYELESLFLEKSAYLKPNAPYLKTLKLNINTLKKSLNRPQEVLIRFRELTRNAQRNEQLLANIEAQLITLRLDSARKEDPWELISDPSVTDNPVSPSRKKSLFYAFLIGLGSSSIYALVDYKKKDIIDELSGFDKILPFECIKTFSEENIEQWSDSFKLFKKNYLINENKIAILLITKEKSTNQEKFERIIRNNTKDDNVIISSNPLDFESCKDLIIFIQKASINRKDLNYLLEDINFLKVNVLGWVLID